MSGTVNLLAARTLDGDGGGIGGAGAGIGAMLASGRALTDSAGGAPIGMNGVGGTGLGAEGHVGSLWSATLGAPLRGKPLTALATCGGVTAALLGDATGAHGDLCGGENGSKVACNDGGHYEGQMKILKGK